MTELNKLPVEDFESLVGQDVVLSVGDGTQRCRVESVWRSPHPTGRDGIGFSVFLRGAPEQPLVQGIHVLDHPRHGALELFLTPVARDADGMRYEIVFN